MKEKKIEQGPPAPHPRPLFKEQEEPREIDNVVMKDIRESLYDARQDIEFNRRTYFGNPVVNHMLKMIGEMLDVVLKYLDFEEVDTEIKGLNKPEEKKPNKKFTFGTSKESFK